MIKTIEFTNDIEKPHISPPNKNSLKKSKKQNQYSASTSSDDDGPDLIRKRLSSDDEEYQIRMQNAEAFMAEREKNYAENNNNLNDSKQKRTKPSKIDHQNQTPQNQNKIIHHYRPLPPNRNLNHLRRPIPISKKSDNKNEEESRPIKYRPQPPGLPRSPIISTPVINNKQAKNDIQEDSYSYTSYCESFDSSSSSSENNLNLNNTLNNDAKATENPEELNESADQKPIENPNTETETKTEIATIPKSVKEKYFYRMEKSTISRIPKKKKKFAFYLGNKVLIESTYVKKQKNIQFLAYDSKKQSERTYTLLIGNQKSSFSLRNGTIFENEIFSMRIIEKKKPFPYLSVILNSFAKTQDFPNKMTNKPPNCDLESPESPNIIFGQRANTIIPSKSNWIFLSPENEELIAVMKGSKSTVFIESIPSVIAPILFTIALVAFIGNPDKK